jgi:hypothetical protein
VSLALDQPKEIIKTRHGDLILDKRFSGRMYLKGLFLGSSTTSKNLNFWYNLYVGGVNRDRQRLIDDVQEAATLAKIWAEAISSKNQKSYESIPRYFERIVKGTGLMSIGRSKTCQRQPYPWSGNNCRKKTLAATFLLQSRTADKV